MPRSSLLVQTVSSLAVLATATAAFAFSYSDWQRGPWERAGDSDGITVYRNAAVDGGLHAYRADVVIDAPVPTVLRAVLDHERAKSRTFVREYDVLEDDGQRTRVYQQIERTGLGRREFTTVGKIFGTSGGDRAGFTFELAEDGRDDPDVPSLAAMEGSFVLTPTDDDRRTRLSYRMLMDPGTWIPNFVLRPALRRGAVEVVENLREDVARP